MDPKASLRLVTAALSLFAVGPARGDEIKPAFRGNVDWISAARVIRPADTAINPGNATFQIPELGVQTELRPNLQVELGPALQLVLRPRFLVLMSEAWIAGDAGTAARSASAEWTQLYGTWNVRDNVSLSYGLQNFQWGPGELMSPSNRIFHEVGLMRDPLYYVRGKHLVRLNLSAGAAWSGIVLLEVGPNSDPAFVAGEAFESKGQLKIERAAADGSRYLGITTGAGSRMHPWFGAYGSMNLTEGLSAYVDTSHSFDLLVWYPEADAAGAVAFVERHPPGHRLRSLVLGGARYVFESGADVRLEYVYDDAGYTRDQITLAGEVARIAGAAGNRLALLPLVTPGLEFLARHLGYASLRLPELPPRKKSSLHLRYLYSLTDRSGFAYVTALTEPGEAWTLFVSLSAAHGPDAGELSRFARLGALAGAVWAL